VLVLCIVSWRTLLTNLPPHLTREPKRALFCRPDIFAQAHQAACKDAAAGDKIARAVYVINAPGQECDFSVPAAAWYPPVGRPPAAVVTNDRDGLLHARPGGNKVFARLVGSKNVIVTTAMPSDPRAMEKYAELAATATRERVNLLDKLMAAERALVAAQTALDAHVRGPNTAETARIKSARDACAASRQAALNQLNDNDTEVR